MHVVARVHVVEAPHAPSRFARYTELGYSTYQLRYRVRTAGRFVSRRLNETSRAGSRWKEWAFEALYRTICPRYLPLVLCVPEVLPVPVLGSIYAPLKLALLSLVVGYGGYLLTVQGADEDSAHVRLDRGTLTKAIGERVVHGAVL